MQVYCSEGYFIYGAILQSIFLYQPVRSHLHQDNPMQKKSWQNWLWEGLLVNSKICKSLDFQPAQHHAGPPSMHTDFVIDLKESSRQLRSFHLPKHLAYMHFQGFEIIFSLICIEFCHKTKEYESGYSRSILPFQMNSTQATYHFHAQTCQQPLVLTVIFKGEHLQNLALKYFWWWTGYWQFCRFFCEQCSFPNWNQSAHTGSYLNFLLFLCPQLAKLWLCSETSSTGCCK